MSRKSRTAAAEALDEIQSAADHMAEWIQTHLMFVVLSVVALLALAGATQYVLTSSSEREASASTALAAARSGYLAAMGAPIGSVEVPELANPQAAAAIRDEYAAEYGKVADAHPGTVAGTLARLEVGNLLETGGDLTVALETWEQLLAEAPDREDLRGLVLQRLAYGYESADRWSDAAARHEEASMLAGFPLRYESLADAARCALAAGERERALALYERLEVQAPEHSLADHQRGQIAALRRELDG